MRFPLPKSGIRVPIRSSGPDDSKDGVAMNQAKVMQILAELGGEARLRDIVEAVYRAGIYERGTLIGGNISKRLKQLAKWGMVVKVKHGFYRLSDR
jgi:hypothetical protein